MYNNCANKRQRTKTLNTIFGKDNSINYALRVSILIFEIMQVYPKEQPGSIRRIGLQEHCCWQRTRRFLDCQTRYYWLYWWTDCSGCSSSSQHYASLPIKELPFEHLLLHLPPPPGMTPSFREPIAVSLESLWGYSAESAVYYGV